MRNERGLLVISIPTKAIATVVYSQGVDPKVREFLEVRYVSYGETATKSQYGFQLIISRFRKIIFSTCAVYLSQGFYFWQGSLINYLLSKTDRTGRSYVYFQSSWTSLRISHWVKRLLETGFWAVFFGYGCYSCCTQDRTYDKQVIIFAVGYVSCRTVKTGRKYS